MTSRLSLLTATLGALALHAAFSGTAHAQSAALYYDSQTEAGWSTAQQTNIEGMAWGYFHTGTLTAPLTITAGDPVAIQLYDQDVGERNVGGSNDELQVWVSDTTLTAAAGESVRFEFFSVVPGDLRRAASETFEGSLELRMRVSDAPGSFATAWAGRTWEGQGRTFDNRASTFSGYPAADHVVRMYYVHAGYGAPTATPGGQSLQQLVESGNKRVLGTASIGSTMVSHSTNENIWGNTLAKGMTGTIIVYNTSDREGLEVTLDYLKVWDEDDTSADDLVVDAHSRAPANFNLGPGGTLKWVIQYEPEWQVIEDARDFFATAEGDLDLYSAFSVNGDPDLPLQIVSDEEFAARLGDQPVTTFSFGASSEGGTLPPPPEVSFSGGLASYTVDEFVDIGCAVTDMGGGIVYDTCQDIDAPAWTFEAGLNTYSASAFDVFGQEGSDTVDFEVEVTPDSLIAITERFVDHNGVENSLVAKIRQADNARTNTAQDAACEAFIHEVEAQAGNHVPELYAEVLIYWAEELKLQ